MSASVNWRDLYYTFGTSGKNYKDAHNFRISLDEKTKCNLKLLKNTILEVNIFCCCLILRFSPLGPVLFLNV